jgi:uncharacterized repeat protein (TIGR03803 family)
MKKNYIIILLSIIFFSSLQTKAQYTKLLDFAGNTNGSRPQGNLYYDGTFLYGMTSMGGINDSGTVFKIKPDGSNFIKLLDFSGITNGSYPQGSLISDGTFLYGMTELGGANNMGVIFKIKTDGSGYAKLLDFASWPVPSANGRLPSGSLVFDGTFLYGMTSGGGANGQGVIFKIKPDGTSYTDLFDFNNTFTYSGNQPTGSLISDGTFLYGMTHLGGVHTDGVIFKIKLDGSGYNKLLDFSSGITGANPEGSLVYDGSFLYGMTWGGGGGGYGTIIKIMPNGTGYTKVLDFNGTPNASIPHGDLIFDGTYLYGMTQYGGTNNYGDIFKIKSDGTGYTSLHGFLNNFVDGLYPYGSLISDGTCLYGMTRNGGVNNQGVIFSLCGVLSGVKQESLSNEKINIYPNPASNVLHIKTLEYVGETDVKIADLLGNQVKFRKLENGKEEKQIDIDDLRDGIYFVTVKTSNEIFTQKIIINKK